MAELALVDEPERVRVALSPPRRRILERLREPASAAQVAAELGLPRQRVGYHFKVLEQAGLIELVEERPRRGCVERLMRATASAFLVDPGVLNETFTAIADRHAAEHLVEVAAGTVREVARMSANAERQGVRLLTFTLEAEVRFAEPGDVHEFTDQLAAAVAEVAARFDTPGGRRYRLVAGGHPAPAEPRGERS
ncbi:winged helix-turn-helix domain-containing protein [Acrocarpospora catenulata]|uniref:winged helix-turn-helix domain-containing protein n=1 Tax=Acrocarpospora catenulata TaxID=2836182 RepID=UPI001BDAD7C3|nr:helix-turn-helix domain-containing protein [Acrocarpospora catenulata]